MSTKREIGLWALKLSPLVILPLAFLALSPWLDDQSDAIEASVAVTFAVVLLTYCVLLAASVNRRLDEVQIAGQRIAHTQGVTIGLIVAVLVITFPPSMNALASLAETIADGSPEKAIKVGIAIGLVLVTLLQTLGVFAAAMWWERRVYGHE